MHQGVVQSSGSPNWWSMRPPLHHQHHSFLAPPPLPPPISQLTVPLIPPLSGAPNSWSELPDQSSLSQLLLGGLVGEDDKSIDMIHMQAKKLENWEQQLFINHHQSSNNFGVDNLGKQENSNYTYNPARNVEFQANSWSHSHQMVSDHSSPKSCITSTLSSTNMFDFSHNKASHDVNPSSNECNSKAIGGAAKKPRINQASSPQSTFKVRKEKLGDRITALHQIVSPFGKTDTASVLLEAIGYIRFLQSQIEALSVPYLGNGSTNTSQQNPLLNEKGIKRKELTSDQECGEEAKKGLRSRGLCLVPISCTLQVGSDNGADYWAPGFGGN